MVGGSQHPLKILFFLRKPTPFFILNVARLCIEAYDDVHAADDVASAVSNVDARELGVRVG
jgi:hypothetical protein